MILGKAEKSQSQSKALRNVGRSCGNVRLMLAAGAMAFLLGLTSWGDQHDRAIRMCLVHDLGEAVTGDILPSENVDMRK